MSLSRTAWLRIDDGAAVLCPTCPDCVAATERAERAGLPIVHETCPECAAVTGLSALSSQLSASPALPSLTGRMHCVCQYCGDRYGDKPCLPSQDGGETHGICPACFPAADAAFAAALAELAPISPNPNPEPPTAAAPAADAMHAQPGTVRAVVEGPDARRYVFARDLATLLGIPYLDLLNRYQPDHWGSPRDFRWTGAAFLIAEPSLPALVRTLAEAGQTDAAERLREYLSATPTGAQSPEPRVQSQTAEAPPEPWLNRWERDHDA